MVSPAAKEAKPMYCNSHNSANVLSPELSGGVQGSAGFEKQAGGTVGDCLTMQSSKRAGVGKSRPYLDHFVRACSISSISSEVRL